MNSVKQGFGLTVGCFTFVVVLLFVLLVLGEFVQRTP